MDRDKLLLELAGFGFLAYEAANEDARCFGEWIASTAHTWPEKDYIQAVYVIATEPREWQ